MSENTQIEYVKQFSQADSLIHFEQTVVTIRDKGRPRYKNKGTLSNIGTCWETGRVLGNEGNRTELSNMLLSNTSDSKSCKSFRLLTSLEGEVKRFAVTEKKRERALGQGRPKSKKSRKRTKKRERERAGCREQRVECRRERKQWCLLTHRETRKGEQVPNLIVTKVKGCC